MIEPHVLHTVASQVAAGDPQHKEHRGRLDELTAKHEALRTEHDALKAKTDALDERLKKLEKP